MIVKTVLKVTAAAAAVGTAVAAAVVAAGFALYALLEPYLGRPGSAAIVALILALIAAIVALVLTRKPHAKAEAQDDSLMGRAIELARSKPIVAAGLAIAAGVVAWRNPALIGILAGAILNRPPPKS